MLVNTLAADEKYLLIQRDNLTTPIQMQFSQTQKTFSQFLASFLKSGLNFKHFEKKGVPHRFRIVEVMDSENVLTSMSKKFRFRRCFDNQYGERAQKLLKSASQLFCHIHWSLAKKLCSKRSLLLECQILGLLLNTLAAGEQYPVLNRDNLAIPIQMQLSQKQKTFYHFLAAFLKSSVNFEHLETKYDCHRFSNFKIKDSENVFR